MKISLRLLIIEDSADITYSLINELRNGNFEPLWLRVDNREEFESVVNKEMWDLVLCDHELMSLSDELTFRYIREKLPETPIILISDAVNEKVVSEAIKSEAIDFVNIHNIARLIFIIKKALKHIENKIENKQTQEELSRRTLEVSGLYEAGIKLGNTLDLSAIYINTYEIVKNYMECDHFVISTYEEKDNLIRCDFMVQRGEIFNVTNLPPLKYTPEGIGTQSDVISSGKPIMVADFELTILKGKQKYFIDSKGKIMGKIPAEEQLEKSALMVPIKYNNKVHGVIQVLSFNVNAYSHHNLKFMEAIAPQIGAAIVNAKLYMKAQNEILEREKASHALRLSESKYKQLFRSIPNPVLIADRKTLDILLANEAAVSHYGYTAEELEKLNLKEIRPQGEIPFLMGLLNTGKFESSNKSDAVHRKKDGSLMYVEITSYPVNYEGREAMVALINDVTKERTTREEITRTKEQIQNIFDNLDSVIWSADTVNKKILQISPACEKILGRTQEEFYNDYNTWFDMIHPEDRSNIAFNEQFANGDTSYSDSFRIIHKNGDVKWIENHYKLTRNGEGEIIRLDGITTDITEKKNADEALIKSEERFKQLSENAGEWIWEVNKDGLYTYSSAIIENILGYRPEEVIGKKYFYDLFEPDSKEELKKAAFNIFSLKQPIRNLININVHKDGRLVILETNGVPILDNKGSLLGYRGADIDVTEKIKIQTELKESEERYKALFDRSFDIVFIHDFLGNFIDCNNTGLELFGYTKQEVPNVKFPDILVGESLKNAFVALEDLLKTGAQKQSMELQVRTKHGKHIIVETISSLILHEGKPVAVQGIARDVTERKKLEEKLKDNEKFLDSIIENIPHTIFVKDAVEHRFLKVNKAAEDLFGFPKEQLLGKNDYDFFSKENADFFISKDNEVIQSGKMQDIPEEAIQTGKLGKRFLHTKKIPVYDDVGNPAYLLGISEDITERKKLEEDLHLTHFSIEKVSDAVVWIDINGNFVRANESVCKLLNMDKNTILKMSVKNFTREYSEVEWRTFWDNSKQSKSFIGEYSIELMPGKPQQIEILVNHIEYSGKEYLVVFARDITRRKIIDAELRKLSRAVDQSIVSIIITDKNGNIEYVNPQFEKDSGYSSIEVLGKNPRILQSGRTGKKVYKEMWSLILNDKEWRGEILNKKKNGELYWEYSSISPIKNEKGEITNFLAIKEDITEKKIIDEQLKDSLKEKEIMLREIHHRVKNNLQIISSLLKLQSSYIKDLEVVEYFNVSQYRIKSMALIHQQLYRSDSLNKIDFQEYLSTLSKDILSIYFNRSKKIEIDVDSKNIFFGIDTAIPCGLLISEMLSNSLKHAFPERKNGEIILKLTKLNGEKYNLLYRDDGVGLPHNFDFEKPDSMGMELIHSLVEQLDGTVEIKNESGTQYNINFTELSYKKRM